MARGLRDHAYLYLRPGELRVPTWADIDLAAMVVHVTKAFDEREQAAKTRKTKNGVRDVPIAPTLVPLLRRMGKDRESHELVVPILQSLTENRRATNLRLDLRRSGCTRPRLFENTATTMAINFRSARQRNHVAGNGRRRPREDATARRSRRHRDDDGLREAGGGSHRHDRRALRPSTSGPGERCTTPGGWWVEATDRGTQSGQQSGQAHRQLNGKY